jgi:transposase/outer membrane murein-binding lipoprotein Lpp
VSTAKLKHKKKEDNMTKTRMTYTEAANALGVSKSTLSRWREQGKLEADLSAPKPMYLVPSEWLTKEVADKAQPVVAKEEVAAQPVVGTPPAAVLPEQYTLKQLRELEKSGDITPAQAKGLKSLIADLREANTPDKNELEIEDARLKSLSAQLDEWEKTLEAAQEQLAKDRKVPEAEIQAIKDEKAELDIRASDLDAREEELANREAELKEAEELLKDPILLLETKRWAIHLYDVIVLDPMFKRLAGRIPPCPLTEDKRDKFARERRDLPKRKPASVKAKKSGRHPTPADIAQYERDDAAQRDLEDQEGHNPDLER